MQATNNMQAINNIRGMAILFIVFTHAIWSMPQVGNVGQFLDFYIGSGTIIFMFIAGYLFSVQADGFDYKEYLKNKLLYVVLPFLVISFPAAMLYVLGLKHQHEWIDLNWFFGLNYLYRYLYITIYGAMLGPLWFIPMIVLFYITAPIFLAIRKYHLCIPAFILSLVVAWYIDRPEGNSNPLQSYIFYIPAYILGIMAHTYHNFVMKAEPYALPLGIGYMIFFALVYFAYPAGTHPSSSDELVLYMPLCIALLLLFSRYLNRRILWLDMFARLSFFIFFIHGYFAGGIRMVLRRAGFVDAIHHPALEILQILSTGTLILVASLACYVVLKTMTGRRSRYLIGG